jgi:hypothetical protein
MKLVFEKVYYPYLLINKKRYAGLNSTDPNKHGYVDIKGLIAKRQDPYLAYKRAYTESTRAIIEVDPVKRPTCLTPLIELMVNIACNRLPIDDYTFVKNCRYTSGTTLTAHMRVVANIKQRTPGREPMSGQKVAYVIIDRPEEPKVNERAEDPAYAQEHGLAIDRAYYVGQTKKQYGELLSPMWVGIHKFISTVTTYCKHASKGESFFDSSGHLTWPETASLEASIRRAAQSIRLRRADEPVVEEDDIVAHTKKRLRQHMTTHQITIAEFTERAVPLDDLQPLDGPMVVPSRQKRLRMTSRSSSSTGTKRRTNPTSTSTSTTTKKMSRSPAIKDANKRKQPARCTRPRRQ